MKTPINAQTSASAKRSSFVRISYRPAVFLLIVMAAFAILHITTRYGFTSANAAERGPATPVLNLEWRHFGNNLANSRYQNVDQINPTNVAGLTPAWIFHTGVLDPEASLEVSPIMVD